MNHKVHLLPTGIATIIHNGRVHTFRQGNRTKEEFIAFLKIQLLKLY